MAVKEHTKVYETDDGNIFFSKDEAVVHELREHIASELRYRTDYPLFGGKGLDKKIDVLALALVRHLIQLGYKISPPVRSIDR